MKPATTRPVRFYFEFAISWLIPENPYKIDSQYSDIGWENSCLQSVEAEIVSRFSGKIVDVKLKSHECIDSSQRLYEARFVICTLEMIPRTQLKGQAGSCSTFSIRSRSFNKIKSDLERDLYSVISREYVTKYFNFIQASSRLFEFGLYLEAELKVKYRISKNDIRAWDGDVEAAINAFNSQMIEFIEGTGWSALEKTTDKIPRSGLYKFDLSAERIHSFCENEIIGDLAALTADVPQAEAAAWGTVDFVGGRIHEILAEEKEHLEQQLFDSGFNLIDIEVYFVDQNDDFMDYSDILLPQNGRGSG